MSQPYRVLFVCLGNICRSPAGENVFRSLTKKANLDQSISCDSAGTIGFHIGKTPDSRMSATIRSRGYQVTGQSRQFTKQDFQDFDLILTMDDSNFADITSLAHTSEDRQKVRKFVDFCTHMDFREVPDPYYGGDEGFETVADLMEDGCAGLLADIRKKCAL